MTASVRHGDCLVLMPTLAECSVDAIVTDPPYGLSFMGRDWDHGVPGVAFWREALRLLKPGGHMLAFGGARTFHRLAVAIEDAGFEIRDTLAWVYGSGFPKSLDVSKAIDKAAGARREVVARQWAGWGTALKPAFEPIILARKPLDGRVVETVQRWGTGALNIDGCRVDSAGENLDGGKTRAAYAGGKDGWRRPFQDDPEYMVERAAREKEKVALAQSLGRWPANLIHDGSEEVLAGFPSSEGGHGGGARLSKSAWRGGGAADRSAPHSFNDGGSAARFFYCAKASKSDRAGSKHPTVKPLALMRYLCRLITPPGGVILDPFAGSGTTGQAAIEEGFRAVLIEREDEFVADIRRRLANAAGPLFDTAHDSRSGFSTSSPLSSNSAIASR